MTARKTEASFSAQTQIISFIYGEALRDAVLQMAFAGEKAWIKEDVPEVKVLLKSYMDEVLSGAFKDEQDRQKHDEVFCQTAKAICKAVNDKGKKRTPQPKSTFTFGNAQKLINIAVKHFYVLCYNDVGRRDLFRHCHCPMDSIMLERVWAEREKWLRGEHQHRDSFLKSWGGEDWERGKQFPARYTIFQNAVLTLAGQVKDDKGQALFPIEYDFYAWRKKEDG